MISLHQLKHRANGGIYLQEVAVRLSGKNHAALAQTMNKHNKLPFNARLIGLKGGKYAGHAYVIEADGRAWIVLEQDLQETCARCRGVDRESWAIYKSIGNSRSTARIVLSHLAAKGELDDPACVEFFGKRLPLLEMQDDDTVVVIDKATAASNTSLQSAYNLVAKHLRL